MPRSASRFDLIDARDAGADDDHLVMGFGLACHVALPNFSLNLFKVDYRPFLPDRGNRSRSVRGGAFQSRNLR